MISDGERREVAGELLGKAKELCRLSRDELGEAIGLCEDDFDTTCDFDQAAYARLADLVDRPTCINESDEDGHFTCSKCRCSVEVAKIVCNDFGEEFPLLLTPKFCPDCGAQVVRDE